MHRYEDVKACRSSSNVEKFSKYFVCMWFVFERIEFNFFLFIDRLKSFYVFWNWFELIEDKIAVIFEIKWVEMGGKWVQQSDFECLEGYECFKKAHCTKMALLPCQLGTKILNTIQFSSSISCIKNQNKFPIYFFNFMSRVSAALHTSTHAQNTQLHFIWHEQINIKLTIESQFRY